MKKFKVALRLKFLSVLQLLALAHLIVEKMTGNANFPAPDPPLADLTGVGNEFLYDCSGLTALDLTPLAL